MKKRSNEVVIRIIVPVILFAIGCFGLFNYLKAGEFGLLKLDVRGKFTDLESTRSGELLQGDKAYGEFHSTYPNLGLISVRFYNQDRDSDDMLVFRLREKGQSDWYYQAEYKTDQFLPHKLFSFGFPIIQNSNGKTFEFELESLRGATGSGILIDYQKPIFIAKSSFDKEVLLSNKTQLSHFLLSKVINIFGDQDTIINALLFFLPLIVYLVYLFSRGISFQFLTVLTIGLTLCDIFYLQGNYDFYLLTIIFLWGLTCRRFSFESRISAVFAIGYLCLTPLLLIFNQDALAEKAAVWAYLFLCVTVIQQIYELRKKPKTLSLKSFSKKFLQPKISPDAPIQKIRFLFKPGAILLSAYFIYVTIKNVINIFGIYRDFFPQNYIFTFIKSTFFAFVLSAIVIFLLRHFTKTIKNYFVRLILLCAVSCWVVGLLLSRTLSFTDDVKVFTIAPQITAEAWVDVTVTGKNFGAMPFVGKVLIDGVEQRVISWSNEKVIFRTNPTITKSGNVVIDTESHKKTKGIKFEYNFK